MRKIKEVLRLKHECGVSERGIALSCQVARSTVADYLQRAAKAGITWTEASRLTEEELEKRLFVAPPPPTSAVARPLPDYQDIYQQLRTYRKFNLTLSQLWLEYKGSHPDGHQYSQFCELYRRWRKKLDYCMRQEHRAGEKVFVDFADGLSIVDRLTGELIPTYLFLAVWGASNYTYAEATLTQALPAWIGAHRRAFEYFQCAPRVLIPDNLKGGVNKACRYEPELNPTYADMAEHYGCAVLPARPYHARDKAKVEVGVLIAKRWILAVLRQRTFFSLAELNDAIHECLERLNTRRLRRAQRSRRELFEAIDRVAALPLPPAAYEYAEWYKARVNIDYHIEVQSHYYSVPYPLIHERLDVRLTATTLEAFRKGERVAAHARSYVKGDFSTLKEHMPPEHRAYAEWSRERFIEAAAKTGTATAQLVEVILSSRPFAEQGYRSCLGIIGLGRHYPPERMEAAARRAIRYHAHSFRSLKAILAAGLDRQPPDGEQLRLPSLPPHQNIRGQAYYHDGGDSV